MNTPVESDSPWLAIIDMQRIFSKYPKWWGCPKFDQIIPPILQLAEVFGDRTLLTRYVAEADPQGSWVPYFQAFPFARVPASSPRYDLVPPIKRLAGKDNVVTMTTFSKWGDARHGLRAKTGKCPHLVLVGVATDCCVLSTATAAAEAGAFVTVALDACAASSPKNQAAAKAIFKGYAPLIQIVSYRDLLPA
jgi:nicotinamidase-related amidase